MAIHGDLLRQAADFAHKNFPNPTEADYNISTIRTFTLAMKEVRSARRAFRLWNQLRNEKIAQEYLVALLIKPRD